MAAPVLDRRPATWADYEALEDDVRAEYIDGYIVVTPSPSWEHQQASGLVWAALRALVLPLGYDAVQAWSWRVGGNEFIPDVVVHPRTADRVRLTGVPVLCVEVLSSNRSNDYVTKTVRYAEAGVDHYWILDPVAGVLDVLARDGQHYRLAQQVTREAAQDVSFGIATLRVDLAELLP